MIIRSQRFTNLGSITQLMKFNLINYNKKIKKIKFISLNLLLDNIIKSKTNN